MASRSLNKVLLIGNLTRDPEVRYTSTGAAMCSFGIATNRTWKDSEGEVKEEAEFHNLVSWNKLAEVCYQILAKGMKVYIEGELRTRSWEGDDGNTRYRTEVKVNDMILLDSRGKSGAGGSKSAGDKDSDSGEEISVDDVMADDEDKESKDTAKAKGSKSSKSKKSETAKKSKPKAKKDDEDSVDILSDDLPF